jgi:two-component sensor histidine kinase
VRRVAPTPHNVIKKGAKKEDRRVHVIVTFGSNFKKRALVDSGATICVMSEELFNRLPRTAIRESRGVTGTTKVTSASSHQLQVRGTHVFICHVEGLGTVSWPFTVVKELSSGLILGQDFLEEFQADINCWERSINFAVSPMVSTIRAAANVYVPPFATSRVKGTTEAVAKEDRLVVVEGSKEEIPTGIQEQKAGENFIEVIVTNNSPSPWTLGKGMLLGNLYTPKSEDCVGVEEIVGKLPEKNPLSKEKEKLIAASARTTLGEEFRQKLVKVLTKHHSAVSQDKGDLGRCNAVPHKLSPRSEEPIFRKQFPLPLAQMSFVNKTVDDLLRVKAIQPDYSSPHNTPVFAVKKPHSEEFRLVQDLRPVNAALHDNLHSFLDVQSCLQKLGGLEAKYFATIDLRSSFFQLELHPDSRKLTRFTVPGRGSFVWQVSPQGLKSSPSAFSRLMEVVMRPVNKSVSYLDDVILAGSSKEELLGVIDQAMGRLAEFNLKANLDKCIFGAEEVEYLGFRVSAGGFRPSTEKTKAIAEYPSPVTPQALRRFVGIANYFRNHVKNFSRLTQHLTKLIRQDSEWKGGPLPEEAQVAFDRIKEALSASPVVHFVKPEGKLELETDGSIDGLGAVLFQIQDGVKKVIAYGSRGLQKHEKNYSAYLLELAAAVFGVETFHVYLWGNNFDLVMDHKPLCTLGSVHKRTLNRLQTLMNEFNFTLRYRKGEDNVVADALSRAPVEAIAHSQDHLVELQKGDPLCRAIYDIIKKGECPSHLDGTAIGEDTRRYLKKIAGWGVLHDGCVSFSRSFGTLTFLSST